MPEPDDASSTSAIARWFDDRSKRRLVTAASVAGVVLGLVAIVVPIVVTAGAQQAGVDTVEVQGQGGGGLPAGEGTVQPIEAGLSSTVAGASVEYTYQGGLSTEQGTPPSFAVPVSAPWEQLWAAMTPDECGGATSEAQFDWLERYGVPIPDHEVSATIANTATSGSEITVSNIRAQGSLTPPAEDTVVVVPTNGGCGAGPGSAEVYAHLVIGVDPVAVYHECYDQWCGTGTDTDPTPGEPVVFTARPGETRTLLLSYDQTVDFTGRFVATVTVDGASSTIDLSPGAADVVAPTVTLTTMRLVIGGNQEYTACTSEWMNEPLEGPQTSLQTCTLETWLAFLDN